MHIGGEVMWEEEERSRLSLIRTEFRHSAQELVLASGTNCPTHETNLKRDGRSKAMFS